MSDRPDPITIPPLEPKPVKSKAMTSEQRDKLYFLREQKKQAQIDQLQVIKDLEDKDYERICKGLGEQLIDKLMSQKAPMKTKKKKAPVVEEEEASASEDEPEEPAMVSKPLKKKSSPAQPKEIKAKSVYKEPEPEEELKPEPALNKTKSRYGQRT